MLTTGELMHLYVLQDVQAKGLKVKNARGHGEISDVIQEAAKGFEAFLHMYDV